MIDDNELTGLTEEAEKVYLSSPARIRRHTLGILLQVYRVHQGCPIMLPKRVADPLFIDSEKEIDDASG